MGRPQRTRTLLVAAVSVAAGCGDAGYRGDWEVVGYRRPGVAAVGALEAETQLGATLRVGEDSASVRGEACALAGSARQTLDIRNLELAYNLMPGELGIPGETVEILDLECSGVPLEFGQQLIRVGRDSLLTPWEGIFLLLEKRGP